MEVKVCRFCLKSNSNNKVGLLKNIFTTILDEFNENIATIAKECAPLEIEENDGYPIFICDICINKLKITSKFISKSVRAQNYFKENALNQLSLSKWDENEELILEDQHVLNEEEGIEKPGKRENYQCSKCPQVLLTPTSKKMHELTHTGEKPFTCNICNKSFRQPSHVIVHKRIHTGEKPYSCEHCDKKFVTSSDQSKHYRNVHNLTKPKQKFLRKLNQNNLNKCENDENYKNNEQNDDLLFECNFCAQNFPNKLALTMHEKTHSGNRPYLCNLCDQTFISKNNLKIHVERKHDLLNEVKKENDDFNFEVKIKEELNEDLENQLNFENIEMQLEDDGKKQVTMVYKCLVCGVWFMSTTEYNNHIEDHFNDDKFLCKACTPVIETIDEDGLVNYIQEEKELVYFDKLSLFFNHIAEEHLNYAEIETSFPLGSGMMLHPNQVSNICRICGKLFRSLFALENHTRIHTGERPYNCSSCGKSFKQRSHLTVHERGHKNERRYKCESCAKTFLTGSALNTHCINSGHTPIRVDKFLSKMKKMKNKILLKEEEEEENETYTTIKKFQCEFCSTQFESSLKCNEHKQVNHIDEKQEMKKWTCTFCDKILSSPYALNTHKRIHTGERPFSCPDCGKGFKQSSHLSIHLRGHKDEKRFSCQWCTKFFITNSALKKHVFARHSEFYKHFLASPAYRAVKRLDSKKKTILPSSYNCHVCLKKFTNNILYRVHMKSHEDSMPYMCEICGKKVRQKSRLRIHMRYHTGDKPFACPECDKKFFTANELKIHRVCHTNELPFKCDICESSFKWKISMWRHMKYHSGERKNKCTYCPKSFYEFGQLKKHLRVHTGERPQKCHICFKSFKEKTHLKTHMRIHFKHTEQPSFSIPNGGGDHLVNKSQKIKSEEIEAIENGVVAKIESVL